MDVTMQGQVDALLTSMFDFLWDIAYTLFSTLISFLTLPSTIGVISALAVIYLWYRLFVRRWIAGTTKANP